MFKNTLAFLLGVFFVSSIQAANLEGLEPKIDQFVQSFQTTPNTGIAVGIVQGDKLIFFKGYGYRDRENKLPVTKDTLFRIGSNTKSFLSTSLAILAEQGSLSLESPVQKYLPNFALENANIASQVLLVDLLSHRVGLPRHDLLWYLTSFNRDELFSKLRYLEMNKKSGFGFRENWQYNNLMYIILGLLGEKVSGKSWQNLIREKLLIPLGMIKTNFSVDDSQADSDFARPCTNESLLSFKQYEPISSAGIMNSSTSDLVKWIGLFLNKGVTANGTRLMSSDNQERMFRVESSWSAPGGSIEFKYGLGWFIQEVANQRLLWHGGNIDGFSTHVSFMPEQNLGLVVLVNQTNGGNFEYPITVTQDGVEYRLLPVMIYEHLLGIKKSSSKKNVSIEAKSLRSFEGFNDHSRSNTSNLVRRLQLDRPTSVHSLKSGQNLGMFSEKAYGDVTLYGDSRSNLHLVYFGINWPLKPTDREDEFKLIVDLDEGDIEMTVRLERVDGHISAVLIPLEPEVSPIRFAK